MSESFPLPTEPEGVIPSLIERFNSGKVDAMMALYAPEAVFIAKDDRTITDCTEIAARFQRDMSLGLPLKANVRHVFVGGDTAQREKGHEDPNHHRRHLRCPCLLDGRRRLRP